MDCDAVCPSWDTSPGAIAFSLPQAPSTHIICHPIAEFAQQCHNLSPDHLPNLQATLFSSQKGSMSPSSPFRPSQGLSHLDGWKLQYRVCSTQMGQAAPEQHCANTPGL